MKRILAAAGAAALCLGILFGFAGCGATRETPPETRTPTSRTEPATWPDGNTILPGEGSVPSGEFPSGESPTGESGALLPGVTPTSEYSVTQAAAGRPADFPSSEILRGKPDAGAKTFTGLLPLPARPVAVEDPNNSRGLPAKKIEHAYGVAKNGAPHSISVNFQNFFDTKHYAAVAYDNVTQGEKTLYLTFDCGYENGNTAKILDVLRDKSVPAAFFCTVDEMRGAPDIVARMINEGHIVGNHSVKHPGFSEIDRARMAQEVIGADNYLRENFGYSAPFFRFPKGEYTESALEAVGSMGFTSVFWSAAYADWDPAAQKGAQFALDTVCSRVHPGCILLLHSVSRDNADAMAQIIDSLRTQGYVFKALTDLPTLR